MSTSAKINWCDDPLDIRLVTLGVVFHYGKYTKKHIKDVLHYIQIAGSHRWNPLTIADIEQTLAIMEGAGFVKTDPYIQFTESGLKSFKFLDKRYRGW